jgi:hypothetical protein
MSFSLLLTCIFITAFVGTRQTIGADWQTYLRIFWMSEDLPTAEALAAYDPGYMLVSILSSWLSGGFLLSNIIFAAIFSFGLYQFAKFTPRPFLVTTAAVPYLVIVVAMGYNRQAAAIGVLLAALPLIRNGQIWRYLLMIALAAAFHKSAVIFGPIGALTVSQNRAIRIFLTALVVCLLYLIFIQGNTDRFEHLYLDRETSSGGAILRLGIGAIASVGWLIIEKRLPLTAYDHRFWRLIAFGSLFLFVLLPVFPSSTALDRLGVYFSPIQFLFAAHLVSRIRRPDMRGALTILVVAFYALFLATWFATTDYIDAWVPYQSYLI